MEQLRQSFKLDEARKIATSLLNRFMESDCCERGGLAGSIRRQKQYVKDIELVVLPKSIDVKDLFETVIGQERHPLFAKTVQSFGHVIKGKPDGRYMQIELPEGIVLDLFIPQKEDFIRQLVIRTGSSDYVRHVIANAWVKNGWVGTPDGLRKAHECEGKKTTDGKTTWKCKHPNPTLPPVWEDEGDLFNWLGLPGAPLPQRREM